jgi:hypothetical protein
VTRQVLHADFISIKPTAEAGSRDGLLEGASNLASLAEVVSVSLIEAEPGAEFDLALLFVLQDFSALEPFGTAEPYSRFLQGRVAPVLRSLAGADVQLERDFPSTARHAACLALAAPPQTYDWEVRELLSSWAAGLDGARSVFGLAIGERQRFRGLAVAFSATPVKSELPEAALGATLVAGKASAL